LVEDNALIQKLNRFYLMSLGCEVRLASSGQMAIEMCSEGFDLVILDIGLPDMTGFEVAKRLRRSQYHTQTPIIALTALSFDIVPSAHAVGMDAVVQKPLLIDEMYSLLQQHLPSYGTLLEAYWDANQQRL
jgi:CheY-like chemotaxis protein